MLLGNTVYFKNEIVSDLTPANGVRDRVAQIENLIDHMMNTALIAVQSGHMVSYTIDTGQTKDSVEYTSVESVLKSVKALEMLKTYYMNKLTGRKFRLVDQSNFRR